MTVLKIFPTTRDQKSVSARNKKYFLVHISQSSTYFTFTSISKLVFKFNSYTKGYIDFGFKRYFFSNDKLKISFHYVC